MHKSPWFSVAFVMFMSAGAIGAAEPLAKDLSGRDLMHSNYAGCDLRNAKIRNAVLSHTNFSNADLRGADLTGSDLAMADFSGVDLRGANLTDARLDRMNLDGADLRGVIGWATVDLGFGEGISVKGVNFSGLDLRNGRIWDCSFEKANFSGADLREAMIASRSFEKANFTNANLTGATLVGPFQGALFDGAKVNGALMLSTSGLEPLSEDLSKRGAIVTGKDFADAVRSGRDFSGAHLEDANLQDLDLSDAKLRGASLRRAHLDRTRLDRADLRQALLPYASIIHTRFNGADISGAYFACASAAGASFEDAKLVGARISSAYFTGVNLRNADLTKASLAYADLTGSDLTGAILDDIDVQAAILDGVKGLDPEKRRELHKQAGRWSYEFHRDLDRFLETCSLPLHILLTLITIVLTCIGLRTGFARPGYIALLAVNIVAASAIPGGLMLAGSGFAGIFLLLGMIQFLGVVFLGAIIVGAFHIIRYVIIPPRNKPGLAASAALLTIANGFFVFHISRMIVEAL